MKTELEQLQTLFDESVPGYELSASKAAEWLADFGYETCVAAVKITAEKERDKPLGYCYGVLKRSTAKKAKSVSHSGFDVELRRRYESCVSDGDLTAMEMSILISARTGGQTDADVLFEAEYQLRRAVYRDSRLWLPLSANMWMQQVWQKLTEDERMLFSLPRLREQVEQLKHQWTGSSGDANVSQADVSEVIASIGEESEFRMTSKSDAEGLVDGMSEDIDPNRISQLTTALYETHSDCEVDDAGKKNDAVVKMSKAEIWRELQRLD